MLFEMPEKMLEVHMLLNRYIMSLRAWDLINTFYNDPWYIVFSFVIYYSQILTNFFTVCIICCHLSAYLFIPASFTFYSALFFALIVETKRYFREFAIVIYTIII